MNMERAQEFQEKMTKETVALLELIGDDADTSKWLHGISLMYIDSEALTVQFYGVDPHMDKDLRRTVFERNSMLSGSYGCHRSAYRGIDFSVCRNDSDTFTQHAT